MKLNKVILATVGASCVLATGRQAVAGPVGLGAAGDFTVLEIGNGNVSMANAANAGFAIGNVGILGTGSISDSGVPITGNVYLGTSTGLNPNVAGNVSGSVIQNATSQSLLNQAFNDAIAASVSAKGLASSGGGVGITSITAGGTLNPGVYNLTDLNLPNGAVLNLKAGGSYVFNISGVLALHSSEILLGTGLSASDVLYNVTSTQAVAFSGGLNNESVLDGVILAPNAQIALTPGAVDGEIISGQNINIASGASIAGVPQVPETSSSWVMLSISLATLLAFARRIKLMVQR